LLIVGFRQPRRDDGLPKMADDAQLEDLRDKQAILDAISRYARGMDRLDRELGYGVFWPEATVDDDTQMYRGTGQGFVDLWMDDSLQFDARSYHLSNTLIEIDGESARSETYGVVTVRRVEQDGTAIDSRKLGRYMDRWERRNREWRIIHRRYVHDFDSSGLFARTGRRDRDDPTYFNDF
jgi:hypothetical protein